MNKKIISIVMSMLITMPSVAQSVITHPWQGNKVAYFGDSITDPNNKASNKKYWSFIKEWLGITPLVYGVSGRQWTDIPRQTAQLKKEHGNDFDAILIFMGTNDYNHAVPLGQWFDEQMESVEYGHEYVKRMENRLRRRPAMDTQTYRGRINIAIDSLKRAFPAKQIVLLTPIHRAGFYAGDKNWQCTEEYQNRCGLYLDSYVDATTEAGNIWAVPVIDLNALCGLYPMSDEHAQYFNQADTDRLHPNDLGHERMARTLMYQLLTLPCNF